MNKLILIVMALCLNVQICDAYKNGTLWPGKTIRLEVDAFAGYMNPQWSVSNPTVSLSGSGFYRNVTANEYFGGTCIITCTYDDHVGTSVYSRKTTWEYDCADNTFTLSPTNMNVGTGEAKPLSWTFGWATYITPSMQFSGYDTSIIDVSSSGMITAKSEGTTTVYVSSNLGSNVASCVVNVSEVYVSPVTITIPPEISLAQGETYQILPTVIPEDSGGRITWTVEDSGIADVDSNGKVTGKAAGVTTITASINHGQAEAYSRVRVRNVDFALKANPVSATVEKGTFVELTTGLQDAVIYYTVDGSYPMENPKLYTGPICVDQPLLINALAYHKDYGLSGLLTEAYDVTSLKVETYAPASGASEVRADVMPAITFNEMIKEGDMERIVMTDKNTGELVAFDYVIEERQLTIVPDSFLEIGEYEIHIPPYAIVNSEGEPNGDILYSFDVMSDGSEGYGSLDAYFRLMDNGNLYVWHKDFPDMNTLERDIDEHIVLSHVDTMFTPYHTYYDGPSQQYYYIDNERMLWGWGWCYKNMGQTNPIGNGTTDNVSVPIRILKNVEDFRNSVYHKGALDNEGRLYLWGDEMYGMIGNGSDGSYDVVTSPTVILSEVEMFDLGQYHTIAVTRDKRLFAWGYGDAIGKYYSADTPMLIDDDVVCACSGARHNLYIKTDRTLWAFGENTPAIGHGHSASADDYVQPVRVLSDVGKCYAGAYESFALRTNGDLYQWGFAAADRLNDLGDIPALVLQDVKDVQVAGMTVYVLKNDGTVWIRGENSSGQLGLGHTSTMSEYYEVFHSPSIENVERIWANKVGCYALKTDGSLWGWGTGLPCDAGSSDEPVELRAGAKYLEGVSILEEDVEMEKGQTKLFHVLAFPENASYTDVEWSSSDEQVVAVSSRGIVRAVNSGRAVLTLAVRTEIGVVFTATCQIIVANTSGVEDGAIPPMNAWVSDGVLHVSGLSKGEVVSVYDCSGLLCAKAKAPMNCMEFSLPRGGVYIVMTNRGNTLKIAACD